MRKRPLIVNLFGGPGSGKSTTAAGVFYNLKMLHMNVELALEFAKELTYEDRGVALDNQPYILGEQYQRLHIRDGHVDAIITDCPIPMGGAYLKDNALSYENSFKKFTVQLFNTMDNFNFFLRRGNGAFKQEGRIQNLDEAVVKDELIENLLKENGIEYSTVVSDGTAVQNILIDVVNKLRQ